MTVIIANKPPARFGASNMATNTANYLACRLGVDIWRNVVRRDSAVVGLIELGRELSGCWGSVGTVDLCLLKSLLWDGQTDFLLRLMGRDNPSFTVF